MKPMVQLKVIDVCKLEKGKEQCMFLARQPNNYNFFCMKITPMAMTIKELTEAQKNRMEEHKLTDDFPVGDNCPGFGVMENPACC